jgi:hypothetical protein
VPFALVNDRAQVWLHENTGTGDISLGVVLDADTSIDGGKATLNFIGLPVTTSVLFMDDPFEGGVHVTAPPTATHEMGWMTGRQDALILGGLGGFFEIKLTVTDYWLKSWALLEGPNALLPVSHDLGKFSNTLTIRAGDVSNQFGETSVPVPAGILLMASAMAGLGALRLRARRS